MAEGMKISEVQYTHHDIIHVLFKGLDGEDHEKYVDICRLDTMSDGKPVKELVSVTIGDKEITAFDLKVLGFLKKEGKL